jgi:hypothetical protein
MGAEAEMCEENFGHEGRGWFTICDVIFLI